MMKRVFSIILLGAICLLAACNSHKATDKALAEVWNSDQSIRIQMAELMKAVTTEGRTDLIDSLIIVGDEMQRRDSVNMAVVADILQRGVPQGLTKESYKTIWIVIDHSSVEEQVQYLPLVEQMASEKLIEKDDFAVFFDRVALGQNRPQRYGSQTVQFGTPGDMQLYVWPVENPATLDSLRESVGLSPLADYLDQLVEITGIRPQFIPTLTIEELNEMRGRVGDVEQPE